MEISIVVLSVLLVIAILVAIGLYANLLVERKEAGDAIECLINLIDAYQFECRRLEEAVTRLGDAVDCRGI